MRILISYLFCTKGGVETALYNRLKTIDKTQLEVDLHFFRDYGGLSLFDDYSGRVIIQSDEKEIQKNINEKSYDMVISIDSLDIIKVLKRMKFAGKIGLEVHTTYEESLLYLNDDLLELVEFIIVPSQYQQNLVKSKISDKKIYVLGNAVSECIANHDCGNNRITRKVILWIGRIDEHKNWRLFLKIAKILYQQKQDYLFWIVGGLKSEQSQIDEFENLIYEYGLECVIRWIPQVPYAYMSEVYSKTANSGGCYISTSTNESFGMTVIEAMACKCPVIVNKVGALPELVADGRGLCIENMEALEQIKKIYNFIEDSSKKCMIERSYKYVKENYSSEYIGFKFSQIIAENAGYRN